MCVFYQFTEMYSCVVHVFTYRSRDSCDVITSGRRVLKTLVRNDVVTVLPERKRSTGQRVERGATNNLSSVRNRSKKLLVLGLKPVTR